MKIKPIQLSSLFFLIIFSLSLPVFAQAQQLPVTINADQINYMQQKRQIVAEGNVTMEYKEVKIFCDKAVYDAEANKAHIIGDVKIIREGSTAYGQDVLYDFNTLEADIEEVKISQPPIYGKANQIKKESENKYVLNRGYVTTCDLEDPHYKLVAKTILIYPGKKVVAKNMVLKVGDFPIFYIPYFSQSLKDESFPVEVIPGKNSHWGYYLLTRWRYNLDEQNKGKVSFDWYQDRGLGTGINHKFESKDYGKALIKYYRIKDDLYKIENRKDLFDQYPERKNDSNLEDDRYKAQLSYNWQPSNRLSLTSEFHKFSDKYFMKDFFEKEYDIDPDPESYLLATYSFDNSSLSLFAQKRVNRFFNETEYLPQLEYNFFRQKLGKTNFYFESIDKLGNLRDTTADSGETNDAFRIYSENILSYQDRIAWLSITPFAGAYTAYYSRNKFGRSDIFRVAPTMGVTLNTKLYKNLDKSFTFFGQKVDKMRHIITPEVEYTYIHDPTVSNGNLFQFDDEDDIERKENIIFRLKNKLQAKNEERTWDFLYFSPSVEYKINEEGVGSRFDNVKADLEIYPTKNISLNSDAKYTFAQEAFTEVNADLTFSSSQTIPIEYEDEVKDESRYSVSLGHRYLKSDSTQGTLNFTYNLTPKLQFKNYMRYEYRTGDLEKQQYALRVDLHCWWMDIGIDFDRQDEGGKDMIFWLTFRLKAFPDINTGFEQTFDSAKSSY
ncbi:MAG: LPS assembly protein LptD [Candidatus Omnitrophica bacterium]|nr:LPS assembly protein LptD [Candidatus Omnitrophota bacterium]MCF7878717.1 LPS assembly protein LptD [Candidatus Omnitrophota bacterium]MCF7892949.1 LPS assembly protein LptD [Candidatus Omnitrophota bacterium]